MKLKGQFSIAIAAMAMCALTGGTPTSAGELSASMLANTCNGCHGPDGSSMGPAAPTIAGTNKYYMVEAMKAFRDDKRPSTVMGRIAKGYSDDEIELIAGFFADKPFMRQDQGADADLAAKGKEIYDNLCEDCHEDNGYSAEDYPALAGQWVPYLNNELADLMSGARDLEQNEELSSKERRKKSRNLEEMKTTYGDDAAKAVIHFFASQTENK